MARLSDNENGSSKDSITLSGEEPIPRSSDTLEVPMAPLIDIGFDDLPSETSETQPPTNHSSIEGNTQDLTVVDQLGILLQPLMRFGNVFEQAYVRPAISLSLNALGVSPPIAQYLETPMTLAFLFTTLFFLVAITGTTSNEVLRLSVVLLAYALKRCFTFFFRVLKITFESVLVFLSLSAVATIGKALLGFPIPNLPTEMPSAEQLSIHIAQAREQIEGVRRYASSVDIRELVDQLSQWKTKIRGAATSLKARFAEQTLWGKMVTLFSAYITLNVVVGGIFHILFVMVVHVFSFIFYWKTLVLMTLVAPIYGISKAIMCCRRRRRRFRLGSRND